MKRTLAVSLLVALMLLAVLAGCAPARPSPASIIISDGSRELEIKPSDAAYAPIVTSLNELIAGLDTPLYAHYPPERVAEEIESKPYLKAVYNPPVTLEGKGYRPEAGQLIVAMTGEGPLTLTQAADDADWTASESSDAGYFQSLFQVVRDRAGIDLEASIR
jgi:hypothetical protein